MVLTERAFLRTIVAASALLAVALPSAGWAQTFRHRDPAHDVLKVWLDQPSTKAPANKIADIAGTTFRHTSNQVTAQIRLRRYRSAFDWDRGIKTPKQSYNVEGWKFPGRRLHVYLARPSEHRFPVQGYPRRYDQRGTRSGSPSPPRACASPAGSERASPTRRTPRQESCTDSCTSMRPWLRAHLAKRP